MRRSPPTLLPAAFVWCAALLGFAGPASALVPDQIALVVNSKVPAGGRLAELYARQRHLPDGRVIALDLPAGDEIAFDAYDRQVVPAVRKALADRGLDQKVTCLVTFYGVPLRIARRSLTAAEADELRALAADIGQATDRARAAVRAAEALARELDPAFKAGGNDELPSLPGRGDAAVNAVVRALGNLPGTARQAAVIDRLTMPLETLSGPLTVARLRAELPPADPTTRPAAGDPQLRAKQLADEVSGLLARANDPAARAAARQLVRANFGAFSELSLLTTQKNSLTPDESESAFDSELSLLWWPAGYPRSRWQANPLYFKARPRVSLAGRPPALMVTRIDAPTEALARDLIATSIRVEHDGLKGQVAIDARGKQPPDPYGQYDQTLRTLAAIVRSKTNLTVVLDDREEVFPKRSVPGVALYCGWYSLRKYVPGMTFSPGAVGYHVASFELVNLHNPKETGWVAGLLNDGVVGTLGPVAEPYLHSFPAADEFFPLLLTGKRPLAEVYWLTNPLASWMNTCIGDPLYTPYAANPAMKVEDLPEPLRAIFNTPSPAARVATRPASN